MKGIFVLVFLLASCAALFPQSDIVNDNDVNVRKYPTNIDSPVLFKLNKSNVVSVYYKTTPDEKVNGEMGSWYHIQYRDPKGDYHPGWVFSKYITLKSSDSDVHPISTLSMKREILADKFIEAKLGLKTYDAMSFRPGPDWKLESKTKTPIWYLRESGYESLFTYVTSFGKVTLLQNEKEQKVTFWSVILSSSIDGFPIVPGMDLASLKNSMGSDFDRKGSILEYYFFDSIQTKMYYVELEGDHVKSTSIYVYYD